MMADMENLDILLYNDTDNLLKAEVRETFQSAFLENPGDYSLAINRFQIPLSNVDILKITDNTDYSIQMELDNVHTAAGAGYKTTAIDYLPLTSSYRYLTPRDFVEAINCTFNSVHKKLLDTNFGSFIDSVNSNNLAFQTAGVLSQNIAVSIAGSTSTYGVELTISDFTQVTQVGAEPDLVNIYLQSPIGSSCLVAQGVILLGGSYSFSDSSVITQPFSETLVSNTVYKPIESFLKFKDDNPTGNWVLQIVPSGNNSLDITVDSVLKVYGTPKHASDDNRFHLHNQSPIITLDDSGYFSITLMERFIRSGIRIKYGKGLRNILSLEKKANSNGYLKLPITTLSTTLDQFKTFKSEAPNIYQMTTIDKILISTNSLPCQKDIGLANKPSNAISSFIIDGSQIEQSTHAIYSFDSGVMNHKRYKLTSTRPLYSFNIVAQIQRKNGDVEDIYLDVNENMTLQIAFYRDS